MKTTSIMQPMGLPKSILFFAIPSLLILTIQRILIPYLDGAGLSPIINFFILGIPHLLFFTGALLAYHREGNSWNWSTFAERFRLIRLYKGDWGWAVIAALSNLGLYFLTTLLALPVLERIAARFPEPPALHRIVGDGTSFVGYPLQGNGWLLLVYLSYFFFNVVGEELWWRGYIFPRQQLVHKQQSWLVHGLLWAGFHLFAPHNALMLLPGALFVSWITQKRQNTWIFVIAHGTLNAMPLIGLVSGILS